MVAEEFIAAKRGSWERLTALIRRAQTNIASLSAEELQELGRLYRQATSDLAVARRDYPGHNVTIYLNSLVAQGHAAVYRGRSTSLSRIGRYFTHSIPRTFRQTLIFTLISFAVFTIPALLACVIAFRSPDEGAQLMPGIAQRIEDIRNKEQWWNEINEIGNAAGAGFIMTNNIRVSILAFAGGMLLGLLTIYVLYFNGLMFGIIVGAAHSLDFADKLWAFVAPHATLELSMIFISGGAGLQLAWAIAHPGLLTRRAALTVAARRAGILMGLVILILIVAGLIEGFISPSGLPLWFKFAVSIGSGIALYCYLFLAGRSIPADEQEQPAEALRLGLDSQALQHPL